MAEYFTATWGVESLSACQASELIETYRNSQHQPTVDRAKKPSHHNPWASVHKNACTEMNRTFDARTVAINLRFGGLSCVWLERLGATLTEDFKHAKEA